MPQQRVRLISWNARAIKAQRASTARPKRHCRYRLLAHTDFPLARGAQGRKEWSFDAFFHATAILG
eukprot:9548431-Karenia_brevis.AAC.1